MRRWPLRGGRCSGRRERMLHVSIFWRGVSRMNALDFRERGGTEISFLTVAKAKEHVEKEAVTAFLREQKVNEGKADRRKNTGGR